VITCRSAGEANGEHLCGPRRTIGCSRTPGHTQSCSMPPLPLILASACVHLNYAWQFPLGHPAVATVIPGGKSPFEVRAAHTAQYGVCSSLRVDMACACR